MDYNFVVESRRDNLYFKFKCLDTIYEYSIKSLYINMHGGEDVEKKRVIIRSVSIE